MTTVRYILTFDLFSLTVLALLIARWTGRIAWPWWLITLPYWLPILIAVLAAAISIAVDHINTRRWL